MNISINDFRTMAQNAMKLESGENTVLRTYATRTGQVGLNTSEWQRIGTRTKEFKHQNLLVRQAFVDALGRELGGLSMKDLPPALAKALKVADFKFDAQGKVTSNKPLTARRVIAITNALSGLSERETAKLNKLETLAGKTPGPVISKVDKISVARIMAKDGNQYNTATVGSALLALDIASKASPGTFSLGKVGSAQSRLANLCEKIAKAVTKETMKFRDEQLEYNKQAHFDKNAPVPERVRRYGMNEMLSVEGTGGAAIALLTICAGRDPEVRKVISAVGKERLTEIFSRVEVDNSKAREMVALGSAQLGREEDEIDGMKNDPNTDPTELAEAQERYEDHVSQFTELVERQTHTSVLYTLFAELSATPLLQD